MHQSTYFPDRLDIPIHCCESSVVVWFVYRASPQQGDLRLSGPSSGQGTCGGAQTRDRRINADLRTDSLSTVPLTPPSVGVAGSES
ncbi:hypothetical protein PoB_003311200 [Plakobranchus ocellatus]|uniref:Uncharacterized protein n=1 Tax=Plakobranchus ocellatus TaxID=259542 RepID=A0AAV4AH72_9GAST|nr:hypothetical protein PoB_003311200 [Plakobranchus ocellatus]